jgi:cyclopropane fatty-acyl-phospholipid synthase-like methyltransferase
MRLKFLALCTSLSLFSSLSAHENLDQLIQESVSQGYHEEFIDLVEMIYGKGFLSQGGVQSIERMIARATLDNRDILDIGSGLGGPTLFLAEHYPLNITGLEPQQWLWKRSLNNLANKQPSLKGSAQFVLMENPANLSQFADATFDLVISKESILHIPLECKKAFFSEINRVLKPDGEIIILDWMRTAPTYSAKTQKMIEMDGVAYHLMTPAEYHTMLEETGFFDIDMENISAETAHYSQGNIDKIQKFASTIREKYGYDVLEYSVESWGYQRDAFASGEFVAGIFRAKKKPLQ